MSDRGGDPSGTILRWLLIGLIVLFIFGVVRCQVQVEPGDATPAVAEEPRP